MTAFATLLICPCARQSSRKLRATVWSERPGLILSARLAGTGRSSGSLSTARALRRRSSARWAWPVCWLARLRGRRRRASGRLKVPVPRFPRVGRGLDRGPTSQKVRAHRGPGSGGAAVRTSPVRCGICDKPKNCGRKTPRWTRSPRVRCSQPRKLCRGPTDVRLRLCPVESCERVRASRVGSGGAAVLTSLQHDPGPAATPRTAADTNPAENGPRS